MVKTIETVEDLAKIAGAELAAKRGKKEKRKPAKKANTPVESFNNVGRYLVTRNRRDRPLMTEMDEFIDGKATDKIIVGSKIVAGNYVPIYKGDEPAPKKVDKFTKWFDKQFGDTPLPLDPAAVASYNRWVDEHGTFAQPKTVTEKPAGDEYKVFVLEFDWNYGHRKEDCKSKKHALVRKEKWASKFYWAEFSNWKMYSEIRFRNEVIVDLEK